MKLNPDCVRDILLSVEKVTTINNDAMFNKDNYAEYELLEKYDFDEIVYHLRQCDMSGYFYECFCDLNWEYTIVDLTPKGHEFLANIRDNTMWNKTKRKAAEIGVASLQMLAQIAAAIAQSQITGMIT